MDAAKSIQPAKLLSESSYTAPKALHVTELFFQVPLDYNSPNSSTITLFANRVTPHIVPLGNDGEDVTKRPYIVYLQGGPGFGNSLPQDHPLTKTVLAKGYQLLLLDHRGTGLSSPVSTEMLSKLGGVDAQVEYLKLMRQDNTVRDLEAVRKCLTQGWPAEKAKWSIFGQSYGGFCSLSYLSMHPEGLREVFLTGGLAPVGKDVDSVYRKTFQKTVERNEAYFKKFPNDIDTLKQIQSYLQSKGGSILLPGGGTLTFPRLLTIGMAFGGHGGFDKVHSTLLSLKTSLDQFGYLSRASLTPVESFTPFDDNIIYAVLHEAIYHDGPNRGSGWSANRVALETPGFAWTDSTSPTAHTTPDFYFSAEHIFKLHFETHVELKPLKEVAEKLADVKDWPRLYDEEQLRRNEVPVYAASYVEDLYVDYDFARDTAKLVKGTKTFETNMIYHNGVRAKTDEVLHHLFLLRDDVID